MGSMEGSVQLDHLEDYSRYADLQISFGSKYTDYSKSPTLNPLASFFLRLSSSEHRHHKISIFSYMLPALSSSSPECLSDSTFFPDLRAQIRRPLQYCIGSQLKGSVSLRYSQYAAAPVIFPRRSQASNHSRTKDVVLDPTHELLLPQLETDRSALLPSRG
jgi:hypothetical protein